MLLKVVHVLIMLKFQILLTMNYDLKILNLQPKINQKILTELKGLKFGAALILVLQKIEGEDKAIHDTFSQHPKAGTIINEGNIGANVIKSIYATVISNIQQFLGKGSGWIIDSVIEYNIYISKCNPLACRGYIKLTKELDYLKKA